MSHFEFIVYRVKEYGRVPNDCNVNRNVKKVFVGSMQSPFEKDITLIQVALYTRYIDIELFFITTWGKLRKILVQIP